MYITRILSQHRRDFQAIYTCEHCKSSHKAYGYDDAHFHDNVIPAMPCKACGKTASDTYEPATPKYQPWEVV